MPEPRVERHPAGYPWRERFPDAAVVLRGEGGAMYAAEEGRSLWLVSDESALADLLGEDDVGGVVTLRRYTDRERWVSDIVHRRHAHARSDRDAEVTTWPMPIDSALIGLVDQTAASLEHLARGKGLKHVNERDHLQPRASRVAHQLEPATLPAPGVSTQLAVSFEHWPRLGNVDLALSWPGFPTLLVELKCGHGRDSLGQCVWDAAKLAYAVQTDTGLGFLLAGAPAVDWDKPVRGAEFFADGGHDMALLRVLYGDWWRHFEKRNDPQPTRLPAQFRTEHVHTASFTVNGNPWDLRLAQVFQWTSEWLEWPRLTTRTEAR